MKAAEYDAELRKLKSKEDNKVQLSIEEQAILLLKFAESAIEIRRKWERMCSYPEEYGDDKVLLKRIKEFFLSENVNLILQTALTGFED